MQVVNYCCCQLSALLQPVPRMYFSDVVLIQDERHRDGDSQLVLSRL